VHDEADADDLEAELCEGFKVANVVGEVEVEVAMLDCVCVSLKGLDASVAEQKDGKTVLPASVRVIVLYTVSVLPARVAV